MDGHFEPPAFQRNRIYQQNEADDNITVILPMIFPDFLTENIRISNHISMTFF